MADAHRFATSSPVAPEAARPAVKPLAPAPEARPTDSEQTTFPTLIVGSLDGAKGGIASGIGRRLAAWTRRNRTDLFIVGGLVLVIAVVHGVGMNANPAPVDDEGTYVAQAWSVVSRHSLTPYTYWYDHPPLAWLLLAGWSWVTHGFRPGQAALEAGRQFVLLSQLISAGLLYLIVRRLALARPWAVAAVILWGLSPLTVLYGRQVYLDNLALPWLLGAFALALSPRRGLWALSGAGALMAGAVLSKETFLIFLPALGWQVWQQSDRRTRAFCMTGFLVGFGLVLVVFPLYALLKGELFPGQGHVSLYDAVWFQVFGRQSNGSIFSSGTQAHGLVTGWLDTDPWLLGAGTVMLPVSLLLRRVRPLAIAYLIGVLVGIRGGYLPQPYVIALLPLATVVTIAGLAWGAARLGDAFSAIRRRWASRRHDPASARRVASGAAALGALGVFVVGAVPAWAHDDHAAMTSDAWGPYRQAEAWIEANVSPSSRILTDDTMFVDLVQHGFTGHLQVVWFYKLGFANNLDPSVARSLPGGWKDFNYVIETPSMRGAVTTDPQKETEVADAIKHSTVVIRFGSGPEEIDVRRVQNGGKR
ncbi:MAG TPA: hypothetical protein VGR90_08045 [Acidimicrobiales bacterium]|nr:hypothetical protein [Acidimicrobiales bacterium]